MEQYLVTKEDIRSLFNEFIRVGIMDSFGDEIISKFFKSKKPVEVIAEGKMVKNILYFPNGGASEGVMFSGKVFDRYDGKKIKIIIEGEA